MEVFLFVALLGLGSILIIVKRRAAKLAVQLQDEIRKLDSANKGMQAEIQQLAVFRHIPEAKAEAERIVAEARSNADTALQEAYQTRAAAE